MKVSPKNHKKKCKQKTPRQHPKSENFLALPQQKREFPVSFFFFFFFFFLHSVIIENVLHLNIKASLIGRKKTHTHTHKKKKKKKKTHKYEKVTLTRAPWATIRSPDFFFI